VLRWRGGEIVGDLDTVPLLDRPHVRRIARISDPHRRRQRIVTVNCDITQGSHRGTRSFAAAPRRGDHTASDGDRRGTRDPRRGWVTVTVTDDQDWSFLISPGVTVQISEKH
jgi:hypothetical protein